MFECINPETKSCQVETDETLLILVKSKWRAFIVWFGKGSVCMNYLSSREMTMDKSKCLIVKWGVWIHVVYI